MGWLDDIFRPVRFGKPDEQKRQEVMNRGYGFSDRDQMGDLYRRNQGDYARNKTALGGNSGGFKGWPAGDLSTQPSYTPTSGMSVDDRRDASMAARAPGIQPVSDADRQASMRWQEQQRTAALLDELMGGMTAEFGGLDRSKVDYGPLQQALKARMDNLNSIRGQTNQNYDKNDLALEQMHRAAQNEIQTKGRAEFQDIGQDNVHDLNADSGAGIQALQAIKNEDAAKRAAMLANIGQTQLAGSADPNAAILTEGQAAIGRRNGANVSEARGKQANNEAFNQTVATSVGQQGVESRAALTQQLQSILGKLGTVEAGYQNDYANQKSALEQRAEDQQYQHFRDRQGFLGDTYNSIQSEADKRQQAAQEFAIAQQKAGQQTPGGYGGMIYDLGKSFPPDQVAKGISALSEVLGSPYMQGINTLDGYTRTDGILRALRDPKWGLDPNMALYMAENLGNQSTIK